MPRPVPRTARGRCRALPPRRPHRPASSPPRCVSPSGARTCPPRSRRRLRTGRPRAPGALPGRRAGVRYPTPVRTPGRTTRSSWTTNTAKTGRRPSSAAHAPRGVPRSRACSRGPRRTSTSAADAARTARSRGSTRPAAGATRTPATRFDVPELRRGAGPTDFGTSGRAGPRRRAGHRFRRHRFRRSRSARPPGPGRARGRPACARPARVRHRTATDRRISGAHSGTGAPGTPVRAEGRRRTHRADRPQPRRARRLRRRPRRRRLRRLRRRR